MRCEFEWIENPFIISVVRFHSKRPATTILHFVDCCFFDWHSEWNSPGINDNIETNGKQQNKRKKKPSESLHTQRQEMCFMACFASSSSWRMPPKKKNCMRQMNWPSKCKERQKRWENGKKWNKLWYIWRLKRSSSAQYSDPRLNVNSFSATISSLLWPVTEIKIFASFAWTSCLLQTN